MAILARACGVPAVGVRAVDCWPLFSSVFSFFFPPRFLSSVATFSHRRSARIKNLFSLNLGVDTFPDPLIHFGAPWRPFWILQAVRRCRRLASAPFAARLVLTKLLLEGFWDKIATKTTSSLSSTTTIKQKQQLQQNISQLLLTQILINMK